MTGGKRAGGTRRPPGGWPPWIAAGVGAVVLGLWLALRPAPSAPPKPVAPSAPAVADNAPSPAPLVADEPDVPLESDAGLESAVTLDLGGGVPLTLVLIHPGRFRMGAAAGETRGPDEQPSHRVTVAKPFYLATTEITQAQYRAVMGEWSRDLWGELRPERPMDRCSFLMAWTFCRKASERTGRALRPPAEKEWEYACRAGTTTAFSSGALAADLKGVGHCSEYRDHNVGPPYPPASLRPNAWGLYDMHGNLEEWCLEKPDSRPAEPDVRWPARETHTPKALRGGWWDAPAADCRSASRRPWTYSDGWAVHSAGIRVVMEVGPARPPKLPPPPPPPPPPPTAEEVEARELAALEAYVKGGGDVNAVLPNGYSTRLTDAVFEGRTKVVAYLIEHGADVSSAPTGGITPLHVAAGANRKEIAELLIAHGAKINARTGHGGETPLHHATRKKSLDVARVLVEKGADLNIRDSTPQRTPIYLAIGWGDVKMVELLVSAGADLTGVRDYAGQTPEAYARQRGNAEIIAIIEKRLKAEGAGQETPVEEEENP